MKRLLIMGMISMISLSGIGFAQENGVSGVENKDEICKIEQRDMELWQAKADRLGITLEELKARVEEDFRAKAENKGMTVEEYKKYLMEYKKYLMEYKKSQKKPFKGMDMTDEEFQAKVQAKLERQAAQKGMGVDEYKEYLKEEYRAKREAFEKEAEENGMSAKEYKQYLYEVKE